MRVKASFFVIVTFVFVSSILPARAETCVGSIYSGGNTASGERSRRGDMTAAHRSLPFGAQVRVTNRNNGRSVVVRINDRGPFVRGRCVDVLPEAGRRLGMDGIAPVIVERVR